MKADRTPSVIARTIVAATALSAAAWVQAAPADPVSNPDKLDYSVVHMTVPDYDVPFQRDGARSTPDTLHAIKAGVTAGQVTQILGEPLERTSGSEGPEWNYNITLRMPASENDLVCQYKVVFDEQEQQVKDTVWRRHQCLDIVNGTAPR